MEGLGGLSATKRLDGLDLKGTITFYLADCGATNVTYLRVLRSLELSNGVFFTEKCYLLHNNVVLTSVWLSMLSLDGSIFCNSSELEVSFLGG